MEIRKQYIVSDNGKMQILFLCMGGEYFITTNGAFGQRDMYIVHCGKEEAEKLIKQNS